MKRLISAGLMFGNLVEISSSALIERYNRALKHLTGSCTRHSQTPSRPWPATGSARTTPPGRALLAHPAVRALPFAPLFQGNRITR